jgi:hypothetical protein
VLSLQWSVCPFCCLGDAAGEVDRCSPCYCPAEVLPLAGAAEGVVQGAFQQLQLQELQVLSCRSHVCAALCWKGGHARGDLRVRCCPCWLAYFCYTSRAASCCPAACCPCRAMLVSLMFAKNKSPPTKYIYIYIHFKSIYIYTNIYLKVQQNTKTIKFTQDIRK